MSQIMYGELQEELRKLNETLKQFKPIYRLGEEQGWKYEEADKTITYFKTTTLLTTPNTHSLEIPFPFRLDRIDMSFLTAGSPSVNAKNVSLRVYSGVSPVTYTQLYYDAANADTSIILQAGLEYSYKAGTKISLVFDTFTNSDTCEITIVIKKII